MTTKYGLLVNNVEGINSDELQARIAVNAYYRAEKRGFEPGHELDDWREAELEIAGRNRYVMHNPIK